MTTSAAVRGHLRGGGWHRLSHGLYLPENAARRPAATLDAWRLVLPVGAAFTHLTAARLSGWWLPEEIDHPVFAAAWGTMTCVRRPGLRLARHQEPLPVERVNGIPVTVASETLLAAARDLSVLDLVVLGDAALHLGHCSVAQLGRTAAQRRWGAVRLREVVPLLDGRSESAWESVLRMLHWAAEVPVEPQYEIRDRRGCPVAYADLRVVGTSRLNEYDGEGHRDKDQYRDDRRRERVLVDLDWQRVGFVAGQVLNEAGDIIAGFDRLLGRRWDPRRLTRWNRMLNQSLLRPAGRARVRARWY